MLKRKKGRTILLRRNMTCLKSLSVAAARQLEALRNRYGTKNSRSCLQCAFGLELPKDPMFGLFQFLLQWFVVPCRNFIFRPPGDYYFSPPTCNFSGLVGKSITWWMRGTIITIEKTCSQWELQPMTIELWQIVVLTSSSVDHFWSRLVMIWIDYGTWLLLTMVDHVRLLLLMVVDHDVGFLLPLMVGHVWLWLWLMVVGKWFMAINGELDYVWLCLVKKWVCRIWRIKLIMFDYG